MFSSLSSKSRMPIAIISRSSSSRPLKTSAAFENMALSLTGGGAGCCSDGGGGGGAAGASGVRRMNWDSYSSLKLRLGDVSKLLLYVVMTSAPFLCPKTDSRPSSPASLHRACRAFPRAAWDAVPQAALPDVRRRCRQVSLPEPMRGLTARSEPAEAYFRHYLPTATPAFSQPPRPSLRRRDRKGSC